MRRWHWPAQQAHPFTLALTLVTVALLQQMRREEEPHWSTCRPVWSCATEHGFPYLQAVGTVSAGMGARRRRAGRRRHGADARGPCRVTCHGSRVLTSHTCSRCSQTPAGVGGQIEAGLGVLEEALMVAETIRGSVSMRRRSASAERGVLAAAMLGTPAKRQPASREPSTLPATSRPSPWNCGPPRVWRGCGSSRASAPPPARCWQKSTAGSQRALTPRTCRRPRLCWRYWGLTQVFNDTLRLVDYLVNVRPIIWGGSGVGGVRSSRPAHSPTTRFRITRIGWSGHSGPKIEVRTISAAVAATIRRLYSPCA